MGKTAIHCFFCDKIGEKANEHVISKALAEFLRVTDALYTDVLNKSQDPKLFNDQNSVHIASLQREHSFSGLLNGGVCKKCNNGWMNQLEIDCKNMLIALVHATRPISNLSDFEKILLARWAVKTAYAWYFADARTLNINSEHPKQLCNRSDALPPGVAVFASQCPLDIGLDHYFSSDWAVTCNPCPGISDADLKTYLTLNRSKIYKLSFQIYNLHLIVSYRADFGASLVPVRKIHELIHSSQSTRVAWLDSDEADQKLKWILSQSPSYIENIHGSIHMMLGVEPSVGEGDCGSVMLASDS